MKSKKEHMDADRFVLGYTDPSIHIFIDSAVKWMGAGHRSINHSSKTIEAIKIFAGEDGGRIALLHLLIDNHIIDVQSLQDSIKSYKIYIRRNSDGNKHVLK